tara:strand:+ start:30520 stop:31185 length:666 start_codon:yes stop_codon:yes gene_type:complete
MNINLLLSETNRSLIYISVLFKNRIQVKKIFYYSKKKGELYKYLKEKKLLTITKVINSNDINSSFLYKNLKLFNNKNIIIYSGYPGQIIRNKKILKKKLIHFHPGNLPFFKGSTTIYYTLLMKKKLCVSTIILNDKIDTGKILFKKFFSPPKNINEIENKFDDYIRGNTLVSFTKNYKSKSSFRKRNTEKTKFNYYIAHPIIRKIVLNKTSVKKLFLKFSI